MLSLRIRLLAITTHGTWYINVNQPLCYGVVNLDHKGGLDRSLHCNVQISIVYRENQMSYASLSATVQFAE